MRNKQVRNIKIKIRLYFLKTRLHTNISLIYKLNIPKYFINESIE